MSTTEKRSGAILVVDDHPRVARAIARELEDQQQAAVLTANSVRKALELLTARVRLVITDVCLGSEDCRAVVEAALRLTPSPQVVVMSGQAERSIVAQLSVMGVDGYLEKPFSLDKLQESLPEPPEVLRRVARVQVGRMGVKEAQDIVRSQMMHEALARTGGSRKGAARILGVHRRVIQRLGAEFSKRSTARD